MEKEFEELLLSRGVSSELFLLTAVELINGTCRRDFSPVDIAELVKRAFRYLRVKASMDDLEAKIKLSTVLYQADVDVNRDSREAEIWARSIYDRRLSGALAACVREFQKQQQDMDDNNSSSLVDLVQRMADEGAPVMCHLVGLVLMDGVGMQRDIERGVAYLKRAAEGGHTAARVELAAILSDEFKYPGLYDMRQSLQLYEETVKKRAENSRRLTPADARALADLARVYYEGGDKIPRDLDKAYEYARQVAEATGEQYCQYIVGDILLNGKKDARQAIFWLTQSGEQGFPLAVETLSRIYFQGFANSIKQDYEQAHDWCLRGDDIWPSGLGFCQTCLGDMYRAGLGVPKDLIKSFEYYQKAASQQDAPQNYARFMLGEMFFKGEGWPQNYAVAAEYYKLAAAENYQPAVDRLRQLAALEEEQKNREIATIASPSTRRKPWRIWSFFGGRRKQSNQAA